MDRKLAVQLVELARRASDSIASTAESVRQRAAGPGAEFFDSNVSGAWANLVIGLMSPAWEQYPDLRPAGPSDGAFDPDRFNLPKDAVIAASRSLSQVQQLVGQIRALVEGSELGDDERARLQHYVGRVEADLRQSRSLLAEQHPDFRGPSPKEAIPE